MEYNLKRNNMFFTLLESIDGAKAALTSAISVIASLFIGKVSDVSVVTSAADPTWFTVLSPYLQTAAWIVAVLAGLITLYKACKRDKKKDNKNEKTTTLP